MLNIGFYQAHVAIRKKARSYGPQGDFKKEHFADYMDFCYSCDIRNGILPMLWLRHENRYNV